MKIKFSIYSVAIIYLISAPLANFLIVTKHNVDTLLTYHYYDRKYPLPDDNNSNSFDSRRLIAYCQELRKAQIFALSASDVLSEFGHPHQRSLHHNMTAESLEIERNQMGLQTVKFKLENSDHLIAQLTFQCMDFDGELKWFVTPAHIPNSAFIFIVQPSIAHVFARQQNNTTDSMVVPARFVAIVDESAFETPGEVVPIIEQSAIINNNSGRDPLCDLNPILKYRLCAIIGAKVEEYPEFADAYNDLYTYQDNWYELRENPRDGCHPVKVHRIRPKIPNLGPITLEMLRCSIASRLNGPILPFYLTLNMLNKTQIIHYTEFLGSISYSLGYSIFHVPLLQHLDEYEKVLKDAPI